MSKRTFPIYKGKDLSKMGMGYSNEKSAKKFMDMKPIIEDFDKLFDDEYWFEHHYLIPLEKTKSYYKNKWGGYSSKTFSIDYQADYKAPYVYLPDVPDDVMPIVKEFMRLQKGWWIRNNKEERIRMDELMLQLADKGYSPHVYEDKKDYKKKLSKFVKENVQFVEKEVTIVAE